MLFVVEKQVSKQAFHKWFGSVAAVHETLVRWRKKKKATMVFPSFSEGYKQNPNPFTGCTVLQVTLLIFHYGVASLLVNTKMLSS